MVNARWHTDSSNRYIPSFESLLYRIEVLPDDAQGGEAEFSNIFATYDALSEELKPRMKPLQMAHSYEFGRCLFPELAPLTQTEREFVPLTSHPLVRVHLHRNNRRSLFMTTSADNEVSGMSLEDGQALHRLRHDHVSNPAICYRHRWQPGDFVIWDNCCTLADADSVLVPLLRMGWRPISMRVSRHH